MIAAVCGYAASLIALAPATLLDSAVASSTAGRLRLAEASGTLWKGSGHLEARDSSATKAVGSRLTWRFDPGHLVRGRLGFQIQVAAAAKSFPLSFSTAGVEITDADLSLPASVLALTMPGVALIGPSGELIIHVTKLRVDEARVSGEAVVNWRSAGSTLTSVAPLGDYELRFQGAPAGLDVSLRTLKGPLHLTGKGSSRDGRPLDLVVNARVDRQKEAELVPFLRLIAIEREPGNFELQVNRNLARTPGPAARLAQP